MEHINLRLRILPPLALVAVFLFAVFAYGLYREESEHISKDFTRNRQAVQDMYTTIVKNRADKLGAALEVIRGNERLVAAMRVRDRRSLLELASPLFKRLKTDYRITHFYFHDPDRMNLLRVYRPSRHGDLIDRFTARTAESTGRLAYGVELGHLGTLTLRVVTPWYDGPRLLGYVELGEEVEDLIRDLGEMFALELYVLIDKKYLVRKDWEAGMRMLDRALDWDRLPAAVVTTATLTPIPDRLLPALAAWVPGTGPADFEVTDTDRIYRAGFIGLKDAGDHPVSSLLVARDMTARIESLYSTIRNTGGVALIVGALLFVGFYTILGRTKRQLANSQRKIVEEGRAGEKLREKHIKELEQLALYDTLTQLPNRQLLHDRLGQAIRIADREKQSLALILLDLDRLKEVNDTLGHQAGDGVLQQVAARLKEGLRKSDIVSRLGSDEFVVLMPTVDLTLAILSVQKIQAWFETSFVVDDVPLDIEASIGVALYPEHATDGRTLLQRADVAMRNAKHSQSGFNVYEAKRAPYNQRRLALFGELRHAIKKRELELYYQPKVDMRDGRTTSVEALVRWRHLDHGFISPAEFIPLVEHTALIGPLTSLVISEALRQCRAWRKSGIDLKVAVNLSTRKLLTTGLPDQIAELHEQFGMTPGCLTLEITESAVMYVPERTLPILVRLHEMGLTLSIDDFGTGYCSLSYLKKIPAEELKIDQSFVSDIKENEHDAVIVRSTIDLAHNLWAQSSGRGCGRSGNLGLATGLWL